MQLQSFLNQIRQQQNELSAAQKLVAAYILEHYHQVPFLSISALADQIGVSNNTIVKFCEQFGFSRFATFKKFISNYVSQQTSPELLMTQKLSDSEDTLHFSHALEDDMNAIQMTLNDAHNQRNLPVLLDMMEQARNIYIMGARSSSVMASLFVTELRYLNYKVHELQVGTCDFLDRLSIIEKEDLVIAFTFPRYTKQIVQGMKELQQDGIPIVLITDTGLSPAHPYADVTFHCNVSSGYYFHCLSGCMSLIGVFCRAAGAKRKEQVTEYMETLESKLLEQGVFL